MFARLSLTTVFLVVVALQESCGLNWGSSKPSNRAAVPAETEDTNRFELHDLRNNSSVTTMLLDRETGRVWQYVNSADTGNGKIQIDPNTGERIQASPGKEVKGQFVEIPVQGLEHDSRDPLGILGPKAAYRYNPQTGKIEGTTPETYSPNNPFVPKDLKEGVETTLADGEVWTLRNGRPARVR